MVKYNFKEVADLALNASNSLVPSWLPQGKREGREWVALNPKRNDKHLGSFKVNLHTGQWCDFSDEKTGADLIALYAYLHDLKQGEAFKEVAKQLNAEIKPLSKDEVTAFHRESNPPYTPILPAPFEPKILKPHPLGEPVAKYAYRMPYGDFMGYMLRFIDEKGDKQNRPYFYHAPDVFYEEEGFRYKGFRGDAPRPLYGMDRLNGNTLPVLMVEGEKCADAGQAKLGHEYNVLSWMGGTSTAPIAEVSLLNGRDVILWPDNDAVGLKAMQQIEMNLKGVAKSVKLLSIPEDKAKGWDIADCIEEGTNPLGFIVEAPDFKETLANNAFFKILGYSVHENKQYFYFFHKPMAHVLKLKVSDFSLDRLQGLAPRLFWDAYFPEADGKANRLKELATERLSLLAERQGYVSLGEMERGLGVWHEDGKIVVHCGNYLMIKGQKVALQDYQGKAIFTRATGEEYIPDYASDSESFELWGLCNNLKWESPYMGTLLAGWLFLAPVCGAMEWRPHIWLSGQSGSGKTWVMNELIKRILGNYCRFYQGATTEAGIRQNLGQNALPVLFDEAECENQKARERMDDVMALMRQASRGNGAMIVKGTGTGQSQVFCIRSMFCFSSIMPAMSLSSDLTRIAQLNLIDPFSNMEEKEAHFNELKGFAKEVLNRPNMPQKMRNRAIRLLPKIETSTKTIREVMKNKLGSARLGDQYGTLLAGAWHLWSEESPTTEEILAFIEPLGFEECEEDRPESDAQQCFSFLMEQVLRVEMSDRITNMSIGEMLEKVCGFTLSNFTPAISTSLVQHGLFPEPHGRLFIPNRHSALKKLLESTSWGVNWNHVLKEIGGAEKKSKWIFGRTVRGISIPVKKGD
jgi:putative DNA primase/helicase